MMIEPTSHPSLVLKVGAVAARWALGLVALAWVVLAIVWGGVHFLIVPRIADLRPWLEMQATKAIGTTVRIGNIAAKAEGVVPSFELHGVTVLDAQAREVLRLPTVSVALSLRSVLGMGLAQLYIEAPVLDVRRAPNGRIWIAGVELPDTTETHDAALDWIFSQAELVVVRGTVHWTDELRAAPPLTLQAVDLVLRNRLRTHAIRLDATHRLLGASASACRAFFVSLYCPATPATGKAGRASFMPISPKWIWANCATTLTWVWTW
jgi:uncharacterized protein YhdP